MNTERKLTTYMLWKVIFLVVVNCLHAPKWTVKVLEVTVDLKILMCILFCNAHVGWFTLHNLDIDVTYHILLFYSKSARPGFSWS